MNMKVGQIPFESTISYKRTLYTLVSSEDVGHDRCMKYNVIRDDNGQATALYIDYAAHVIHGNQIYYITTPSWDGWASD